MELEGVVRVVLGICTTVYPRCDVETIFVVGLGAAVIAFFSLVYKLLSIERDPVDDDYYGCIEGIDLLVDSLRGGNSQ
jgi:hypothetical protein